jgi:hypothetical protein
MSWSSSSAASPLAPCAAASVSAIPRTTSSRTLSTKGSAPDCCQILLSHLERQMPLYQFTGEHPLFFLPFPIHDVIVSDCCSGLIICWCFGCRYVVCNSVTNKCLLLPDNLRSCGKARLGFNPTVSSHFHVFEYGKMREGEFVGVSIYSSKSATWIFKESKWGNGIIISTYARSVFLNGFMHCLSSPRSLLLIWTERHG